MSTLAILRGLLLRGNPPLMHVALGFARFLHKQEQDCERLLLYYYIRMLYKWLPVGQLGILGSQAPNQGLFHGQYMVGRSIANNLVILFPASRCIRMTGINCSCHHCNDLPEGGFPIHGAQCQSPSWRL
eukprot:scaffold290531_cov19-Tisochrysis_lutea.AAC.1